MTLIEACGISYSIQSKTLIEDISLEWAGGQMIGLIGPNGAGKSTLIRTLCHLLKPTQGSVRVKGRAIERYRRKELAKLVGYLPQGQTLHWPLEVDQLVALGRLPHRSPLVRLQKADREAVARAAARADISAFRSRMADTLSGGERARVMLARALAAEPAILLADEPVASLDPYHQLQVMELLQGLARDGVLVVCVLHDLPLAARFCDQLVLMESGRLVTQGEPDKVLERVHLNTAYRVSGIYGSSEGQNYVLPWRRLGA